MSEKEFEIIEKIVEREDVDIIRRKSWIWLPHPAHFVGAFRCDFRLATVVGDFIISTVGEYRFSADKKISKIGPDRFYETMVFFKKDYNLENCGCYKFEIDGDCIELDGYDKCDEAMSGHNKICRKYSMLKKVYMLKSVKSMSLEKRDFICRLNGDESMEQINEMVKAYINFMNRNRN